MVKYLGSGGRRYESGKLGAWFSTDDFLQNWGDDPQIASPAKDMHAYLSRAGNFVDHETFQRRDHYCGLKVYHYGEATVSVKYHFLMDMSGRDVAGKLSVNMVSNGPVDDVMLRIGTKFPFLKENASIDDIRVPLDKEE